MLDPETGRPLLTAAELDAVAARFEAWADSQQRENPAIDSVERDEDENVHRWFIRVLGEEKSVFSVWFHLTQRALHVETYVMPKPEENIEAVYENLLRRNDKFRGLAYTIGDEDGLYIKGEVPVQWVDEAELDRLLGSVYMYVEASFRPAMRLGFASRFKG